MYSPAWADETPLTRAMWRSFRRRSISGLRPHHVRSARSDHRASRDAAGEPRRARRAGNPDPRSPMTKDPKTQIMVAAAVVMTRPVETIPSATAAPGSPLWRQEDLVVHGQSEGDGEHHQRYPRVDESSAADREHRGKPAPLVDRDDGPVGGPDREQVHDRGLQGMATDRNTTTSSMNDSKITRPMTSGSGCETYDDASTPADENPHVGAGQRDVKPGPYRSR
jgi:hypothetical protein